MKNLARFTTFVLMCSALVVACTTLAEKEAPCTLIENQPEGTAREVATLTAENVDKIIVKGGPTCIVVEDSRSSDVTVIHSGDPAKADCEGEQENRVQYQAGSIIITWEEDTAMLAPRFQVTVDQKVLNRLNLSEKEVMALRQGIIITYEEDTIQ
jgi:hypothetical protein